MKPQSKNAPLQVKLLHLKLYSSKNRYISSKIDKKKKKKRSSLHSTVPFFSLYCYTVCCKSLYCIIIDVSPCKQNCNIAAGQAGCFFAT